MLCKISDKIKIRKDLKPGIMYGTRIFTEGMKKYRGKTLTIIHILNGRYIVNDKGFYSWTDEMINHKKTKLNEKHKRIVTSNVKQSKRV